MSPPKHSKICIFLLLFCSWFSALAFALPLPRGRGGAGRGGGGMASRTVDLDPRLIGRRTSLAYILGSISPLGWFLIFFGKFVFVAVLVLFCRRRCCEGGRCCCEKDPATAATAAEVPGSFPCHLCQEPCLPLNWDAHRRGCASVNRDLLRAMDRGPEGLKCPKCRKRLRKWPAGLGPPFQCKSRECPILGRIVSTGDNRFSCFPCDYDACDTCARRKVAAATAAADTEARQGAQRRERQERRQERRRNQVQAERIQEKRSMAPPQSSPPGSSLPSAPPAPSGASIPAPSAAVGRNGTEDEDPLLPEMPPTYDEAMRMKQQS